MPKFSLQPVLEVRKRSEEAAQREVAEALREMSAIEEGLVSLEDRLSSSSEQWRALLREGAYDPALQRIHSAFDTDMRSRIMEARERVVEAAAEVERRRERLRQAARERQVMDELRKVEDEEFQQRERELDRKVNDDVALFAYGRLRAERYSGR